MKTNRRKFLGLLGMSPIAAKAAADELIVGSMTNGMGAVGFYPTPPNVAGSPTAIGFMGPQEPYWMKPLRWLKNNSLPSWQEQEIREQTRHVAALDPDIAAKRSWSAAVKMQEQRDRNYARRIEQMKSGYASQGLREQFFQQNGFYF